MLISCKRSKLSGGGEFFFDPGPKSFEDGGVLGEQLHLLDHPGDAYAD